MCIKIPININQGLYIVTAVNFEEKKHLDLVNINAYTNFGNFCPFVLKLLSVNEILTSIKVHSSTEVIKCLLHS